MAADAQCRSVKGPPFTPELLEGSRVFMKRIRKKGEGKLTPNWSGPFRVVKSPKPYVYDIKPVRGGKTIRVHMDNLKPLALEKTINDKVAPGARDVFPPEVSEQECTELEGEYSAAQNENVPNTVLDGAGSNVGNDTHVGPSGTSNDDRVRSPNGVGQQASVIPSTTDDTASHAAPERLCVNDNEEGMYDFEGFDVNDFEGFDVNDFEGFDQNEGESSSNRRGRARGPERDPGYCRRMHQGTQ